MDTLTLIDSFSRKTKLEKLEIISSLYSDPNKFKHTIRSFLHPDQKVQQILDEISENTLTNFPLPYGISPNYIVNGDVVHIPMVVEESSVVAAAGNAAKFWIDKGGFKTRVLSTTKSGQVHFLWNGNKEILFANFKIIKRLLRVSTLELTEKMVKRGGGILEIRLEKRSNVNPDYYCLDVEFETVDSMGANFINSCLEEMALVLDQYFNEHFPENRFEVIMSILSNYNPGCLVECVVECNVSNLIPNNIKAAENFAKRFDIAVKIAENDPFRATTHNKGIMNGVDAVVIATGNDFRAVEAGAHAYASRQGTYASLTSVNISNGIFSYKLVLPLALGTIGGLTSLHPLARISLEILGNPSAEKLMQIAATAGMANNFSAIRALITHGIQKGHMKIHLSNILNTLEANQDEKKLAQRFFKSQKISYRAVADFLKTLRNGHA
jgi:hydroxymethylglutaryl-CoA reductase